jgi:uncharacterized protein (DUF608 family)
MSDQIENPTPDSTPADADAGVARRRFLQFVGMSSAALLLNKANALANPEERPDFTHLVPENKGLSADWVKSLFDRGQPRVYRGDQLKYIGMPCGGIGAGYLYIGGDGKLWHWDIFNITQNTQGSHYAHPQLPNHPLEQDFSIQLSRDGKTTARSLDITGFPAVSFQGQYPIATVDYTADDYPLKITLQAFSPFVPLAADDSSLPATILRFSLTNSSSSAVEGTLLGRLENAVAHTVPAAADLRRNKIVNANGVSVLSCSLDEPAAAPQSAPQPDLIFEDWNKETYTGWTVEGSAFGVKPARRADVPKYMGDIGGTFDRFVHSHVSAPGQSVGEKDAQTGKLTSDPFTITRRFIQFWIDGGNHPGSTCINLLIEGKVARTATGKDDNRMSRASFDVEQFIGQHATLQIVDAQSGAWANIGIGPITFTDLSGAGDLKDAPDYGNMALGLLGAPAEYSVAVDQDAAAPAPDGAAKPADKLIGAIGRKFKLAAGESVEIDFVLAWYFPNLVLHGLPSKGRFYSSKVESSQAVAQYVTDNFQRLCAQTTLWRDTWYDSTLPQWFLDRTFQNICNVATSTSFRLADGRFYSWEGVASCPGTCTHVWHYAHALARLFPALERDTRERVDLGVGFNPQSGVMGFRAEFDRNLAVDGQAGTLLRIYREHQHSPDDSFLRRNWPKIRKAFDPLLKLDGDQDGILEGAQMNTLDQPWYGKIAWMSSLYNAALLAGEQMARVVGDDQFADHCKQIASRGSQNIVKELFDGEYFFNEVDPNKLNKINSGTGCEIDQVFGQSWAFQVHLGRVLPKNETRSALRSLWKYNFTPNVGPYREHYKSGRWFAMPGEAGLLMCSFPRPSWDYEQAHGKGQAEWAAGYLNECMNGFEYQVAGHMIWEGMVKEGLAITRALDDRYAPEKRNPWNEIECGDHYSRSMASYGVFIAACGYEYDGPAGYLAFAPRVSPEDFKCPFTAAEGWGTYSQQIAPNAFNAQLALKYGKLRLASLALDIPPSLQPTTALAKVSGSAVAARLKIEGRRAVVNFIDAQTIAPDGNLEVAIS